jgi:hypothetical protein
MSHGQWGTAVDLLLSGPNVRKQQTMRRAGQAGEPKLLEIGTEVAKLFAGARRLK